MAYVIAFLNKVNEYIDKVLAFLAKVSAELKAEDDAADAE